MPVDGTVREYTWEDILCLILRDIGLDSKDRKHHDMWYLGGFNQPQCVKDACIRVTKYKMDGRARLEEHAKEKL